MRHLISLISVITTLAASGAVTFTEVADGYCRTSVNAAVFRASSIVSNDSLQYISFYDPDGYVVIGRRHPDSPDWTLQRSGYKGRVTDGHNVISIGLDASGVLHAAFDHHGDSLRYCRAIAPGSIELGELTPMTGRNESNVTYPEFHTLADGTMLFAYRDGASGCGNLILNRYDISSGRWQRIHDIVIDGEGKRNAYWQLHSDSAGRLHLSWVWRESWLVETNHDICYATSADGGTSWTRSDGEPYSLPITAQNAEIAWSVPQNSELINQTGMTADAESHPYIATYWREESDSVPQYRIVWHNGESWQMATVTDRRTPFSLKGGGTKMIPISRPRIASDGTAAYMLFRDAERGSRVSLAATPRLGEEGWTVTDLTDWPVDAWEPTYDVRLWESRRRLDIFLQRVHQGDGEKVADTDETSSKIFVLTYE